MAFPATPNGAGHSSHDTHRSPLPLTMRAPCRCYAVTTFPCHSCITKSRCRPIASSPLYTFQLHCLPALKEFKRRWFDSWDWRKKLYWSHFGSVRDWFSLFLLLCLWVFTWCLSLMRSSQWMLVVIVFKIFLTDFYLFSFYWILPIFWVTACVIDTTLFSLFFCDNHSLFLGLSPFARFYCCLCLFIFATIGSYVLLMSSFAYSFLCALDFNRHSDWLFPHIPLGTS